MAEGSVNNASVSCDLTAKLTDDILSDIISRIPYKCTCCCKCVSMRWRDLISHPYHRKKMPQSLIGFFHKNFYRNRSPKYVRCFTNISGIGHPLVDPSLSFLPKFEALDIKDCCNGLLLCSFYRQNDPEKRDYIVCNPATEKWVLVPGTDWSSEADVRLAFDPAVSSHFHVCEFVLEEFWVNLDDIDPNEEFISDDGCIAAVVIYSSKTGVWSHKADAWSGYLVETFRLPNSVLFKGVLYLCACDHKLIALDVEENNYKVTPLPRTECRSNLSYDIFLSQGQLHFAHNGDYELTMWVLEDPGSENWNLKHNVTHFQLADFVTHLQLQLVGSEDAKYAAGYRVFSIHPDRNLIFLVCRYEETLIVYDMDSRELRFLCQLGRDCQIQWSKIRYLPYVPLYSDLLSDGH